MFFVCSFVRLSRDNERGRKGIEKREKKKRKEKREKRREGPIDNYPGGFLLPKGESPETKERKSNRARE